MKLRHKQSGVEIEGPWCTVNWNYGRATQAYHKPSERTLYYAPEWELVQPEPADISNECDVVDRNYIAWRGRDIASAMNGFTFHKALMSRGQEPRQWAFILVKEQP